MYIIAYYLLTSGANDNNHTVFSVIQNMCI